jgi:hypothetical protein
LIARSAAWAIARPHRKSVIAVARLTELLAYTGTRPELAAHQATLLAYRARYGIAV